MKILTDYFICLFYLQQSEFKDKHGANKKEQVRRQCSKELVCSFSQTLAQGNENFYYSWCIPVGSKIDAKRVARESSNLRVCVNEATQGTL